MYTLVIHVLFVSFSCVQGKSYCGSDTTEKNEITVGIHKVEDYPWMGILYYPTKDGRIYTTAVVLVSRQVVLAAANEIDPLPKTNFRALSRVILGQKCRGTDGFKVRDYTYHPEYSGNSFSLAMVHIITKYFYGDLIPICPPPEELVDNTYYAMVLSDECTDLSVSIHKMTYVLSKECREFYQEAGLNAASMSPRIPLCARSNTSGHCIWRSGAILTTNYKGSWQLLGFHVYGPACESPARFIDYGMYYNWVKTSMENIGAPSVTSLSPNQVVLRRASTELYRTGPCDAEEKGYRIYDEETQVMTIHSDHGMLTYNLSLHAQVDYDCVFFTAEYVDKSTVKPPLIRVQKWHSWDVPCMIYSMTETTIYIDLIFKDIVKYNIQAFGRLVNYIDPKNVMMHINFHTGVNATVRGVQTNRKLFRKEKRYKWWPQREGHPNKWW